ncbi:hypothetical protein HMPREF9318_00287 [Streptococcus urinalis FB127-CNA-2]|uniref:High-affinity heme uptake system protein IsdE n=1 Tax=Streptococcus urinalis 2285-97 TaxID=764291 RepID=G5KFM6_9STRE|nr:putative high-affinity heme uptake system protein IsdE [Streptococcus urinalis 2285-97]EKS22089.1 hypothetical protein HMPREF9318_00287 [Streptococcus urinalis FB127-CNA-2]VEF31901.1 heme-binding lipoprotein [Streptococcus urinalis]
MFHSEFKENDIWQHFDVVKNNKVYDLDNHLFGMSAKLNYKEAMLDLSKYFNEK